MKFNLSKEDESDSSDSYDTGINLKPLNQD